MKKLVFIFVLVLLFLKNYAQESPGVMVENYQKLGADEAVRAILIDRQNYKWLGTDRGLYRMVSMEIEPELLFKDSICGLAEDKSELVWFGNRKQLIISEDRNNSIYLGKDQAEITSMAYYNGDLWVGTNMGLFRISEQQKKVVKHYTVENSKLKSNQINMIYKDEENKLWVGTDQGVAIINKKDWSYYEKDYKITGAIATSEGVWLLSDTRMWLIFKEDGRDRWQDAAVRRGLSKGPVRALASDSKGRVYIASEILVQFDPYSDKSLQIDEDYGFVSSQTLSLACDKNDDLWVGTADRGLFKIDMLDGKDENFSVVAFSKGELKCPGDKTASINVIVKGGKTPYSFQWSQPELSGAKLDSVGAGAYAVTVTDAEGEEYIANVVVDEPDPFLIEIISKERVTETNRKDGKASIDIKGGTPPYRILWDNGKTSTNVTNLSGGKHTVRIADANFCQKTAEVYIDQPKIIPDLVRSKIQVGQTLRINELFFTADSSVISADSYSVLDEIFQFLNANKDVVIEIGGHTNGIPAHEYCDWLSSLRANNVAQYLYERGIASQQISFKGYGKRVPIASNDTQAGRIRNQRVEIKILSIKQG
ncbi:MAG: OmpA family protein [Bacteroidota bacterium]|nr:OmpA family protein [Bacteroidota bacterium]